jgi:hypothetical protein
MTLAPAVAESAEAAEGQRDPPPGVEQRDPGAGKVFGLYPGPDIYRWMGKTS